MTPSARKPADPRDLFAGGSEMAAVMRAVDWARRRSGPSTAGRRRCGRRSACSCTTDSRCCSGGDRSSSSSTTTPIGPCWATSTRARWAKPTAECWSEVWHVIGPMIEAPFRGGPATTRATTWTCCSIRQGFLEETHFNVAYSPVPDDTVAGDRHRRRARHRRRDDRAGVRRAAAPHAARAGRARRRGEDGGAGVPAGRRGARQEPSATSRSRCSTCSTTRATRARLRRSVGFADGDAKLAPRRPRPRSRSGDAGVAARSVLDGAAPDRARRPRRALRPARRRAVGGAAAQGDRAAARVARPGTSVWRAALRRQPAPRASTTATARSSSWPPGRSPPRSATRAPTRRSAGAPRRWPSSIAPRPRSSPTSATSSARRSR